MAVGFRLASYKRGSIAVVGVDGIPFVSEPMRAVVASFEAFVRNSGLSKGAKKSRWKWRVGGLYKFQIIL